MRNRAYLILFISILFLEFESNAQKVIIPEVMYFAGMKLNLSKGAREIIEKDFITITKNQKYFTSITQRADLYFPIIEKVFREESAPPDFKYLALQESSLQPNVVSKSNAVGYWQFKKESAKEVGLQVDRDVDERMNIEASSRGAAKYLKKGNQVLNNWIYTLLAYYLGRGGVMPYVKEKYRNSNEMDIDEDMNWYVLRFLAHKYAYERVVGQLPHPQLRLAMYQDCNGKSLKQIAEEKNIEISLIEDYNKWLLSRKIPYERTYTVILPFKIDQDLSGENVVFADKTEVQPKVVNPPIITKGSSKKKKDKSPSKEELGFDPTDIPLVSEHNKLRAIQARKNDSFAKLAYAGKISMAHFLAHNDLESFDKPVVGEFYYLEPKRNKALVMTHTVQNGETIHKISQMYGIRIESIRKKNRMKMHENVHVGQLLYLTKKISKSEKQQSKSTPLFIKKSEEVQQQETTSPNIEIQQPSSNNLPTQIIQPEEQPISAPTPTVTKDTSRYVLIDMRTSEDKKEQNNKLNQTNQNPTPPSDSIRKTVTSVSSTKTSNDVINTPQLKDSLTYHIVQSGQTLYFISRTYSTPIDSLKLWNNLQGNEISIGKQLIVAKPKTKSSENISKNNSIYVVKVGDTIYRIARMYGVSVQEILKWNNKETMILSIGENIKILKE